MAKFEMIAQESSSDVGKEWHEAIQEMKLRLQEQLSSYSSWESATLEAISALLVSLDQDLAAIGSGESSVRSPMVETEEKAKEAAAACQQLCDQRRSDVDALLQLADELDAYLTGSLDGSDDQKVIDNLEGSDQWQALTSVPDRADLINCFSSLAAEVNFALELVLSSEKELHTEKEHLWRVSSSVGGADAMQSVVLWDKIHDGSIRSLLPGLAGDTIRAASS